MPPTDLPRIPHQRKLNDAHHANASGLYSYANVQNSAGNGSRITTSSHHGLSRGTQTVMTCSVEGNRGHHCCCVSERVHPSGTSQSHGSTNSKRIADSAIKCQGGSQNGRGVTGALKALLLMSHSLNGNCGASTIAIDNKIEQAMDLVKSHLMFAVREEVEVLKEQIKDLVEKNSQLEMENNVLRANATKETLSQLSTNQPPAGATTTTQTSQGPTSASTSQPTNSTTQPPTQQPQKS